MRSSLSIIDYLNALPLNLAFKDHVFGDQIGLTFDYPSQCADNLAAGRVDGGLISSIEYQRIPNLTIAPGICIAAKKRVKSVVIVSRKALEDVEMIAVDRFSRSSVTLVEILFWRQFKRRLKIVAMAPDREAMLAVADAALIIGDAALRLSPSDEAIHDLAAWWYAETGLSFVFAFWALRENDNDRWLASCLTDAKEYGKRHLSERWDAAARRWGIAESDIEHYLTQVIQYDMGDEEHKSLETYYRYAKECGAIAHIKPLRFTG